MRTERIGTSSDQHTTEYRGERELVAAGAREQSELELGVQKKTGGRDVRI
jgi:hypothetical protein